jgi:hypothetical protein
VRKEVAGNRQWTNLFIVFYPVILHRRHFVATHGIQKLRALTCGGVLIAQDDSLVLDL